MHIKSIQQASNLYNGNRSGISIFINTFEIFIRSPVRSTTVVRSIIIQL